MAKKRVTFDQNFGKRSSREVLAEERAARDVKPVSKKPLTEDQRAMMRQIFEEVYRTRKWSIIWQNFLRGMFFGFGSIVGGTIIVAILIWILSQTVDIFPPIRDFVERIIDSLSKR